MKPKKLSVVIATHNEQKYIAQCIRSVKSIADEIIVVDGESADDTVKIARKLGARIIETSNKPIFHINKQMGLDNAKSKWIFQLDADEIVSKALAREINQVIKMSDQQIINRDIDDIKLRLFRRHQDLIQDRDGLVYDEKKPVAAFFIPRVNVFLGRKMSRGGLYPDGVIRLVRKGRARFPCKSVHEQIDVDGSVSWLENSLEHHDSPTFSKYIARANRYTDLTARNLYSNKVRLSIINDVKYLLFLPLVTFIRLYLRHRGYKDEFPGFVWALFSGLHHALAYMKLGDIYRSES